MSDGDVTEGFTSITVAPDETRIQYVNRRAPTGARVTLEFSRHAPLPPDLNIRVHFDIAENGDRREIRGIPKLTHTPPRRVAMPARHTTIDCRTGFPRYPSCSSCRSRQRVDRAVHCLTKLP